MNKDAAMAAIEFALTDHSDGMQFLRRWSQGEFHKCRKWWPEAPEAVYIVTDPMLPTPANKDCCFPLCQAEATQQQIAADTYRQLYSGAAPGDLDAEIERLALKHVAPQFNELFPSDNYRRTEQFKRQRTFTVELLNCRLWEELEQQRQLAEARKLLKELTNYVQSTSLRMQVSKELLKQVAAFLGPPAVEKEVASARPVADLLTDAAIEEIGHSYASDISVETQDFPYVPFARAILAASSQANPAQEPSMSMYASVVDYKDAQSKWDVQAPAEKAGGLLPLDFSKPLETEGGKPVAYVCSDVIEYQCARMCVDQSTGVVYSSPYKGLKIRNVADNPTVADAGGQDEYRQAWYAVFEALQKAYPEWIKAQGNGKNKAVAAIHALAARSTTQPAAQAQDKQDAERIDWIEKAIQEGGAVYFLPFGPERCFVQVRTPDQCWNGPTVRGMRAAIDAARATILTTKGAKP